MISFWKPSFFIDWWQLIFRMPSCHQIVYSQWWKIVIGWCPHSKLRSKFYRSLFKETFYDSLPIPCVLHKNSETASHWLCAIYSSGMPRLHVSCLESLRSIWLKCDFLLEVFSYSSLFPQIYFSWVLMYLSHREVYFFLFPISNHSPTSSWFCFFNIPESAYTGVRYTCPWLSSVSTSWVNLYIKLIVNLSFFFYKMAF